MGRTIVSTQVIGRSGERRAAQYLRSNGYRVIERNWTCRYGEIDIIVFTPRSHQYVFIEVKTSRSSRFGNPAGWITPTKLARIHKSILVYQQAHSYVERVRCDVIVIFRNGLQHYRGVECSG